MLPALNKIEKMGIAIEVVAERKLDKYTEKLTPCARFSNRELYDIGIENVYIYNNEMWQEVNKDMENKFNWKSYGVHGVVDLKKGILLKARLGELRKNQ